MTFMTDILKVFEYNQHFVAMMNIINMARLNPPVKGHKHHIIPRCWFKAHNLPVDNSKDNLVLLSYEDHCRVHKLAAMCALTSKFKGKMAYAYLILSSGEIVDNEAFTGEQNPMYGKHHSEESKKKMSEAKKGEKNPYYGRHHSEETRKKMTEALKGENNPLYGKHHSEETRKKMSESKKGKHHSEETRKKMSESHKGIHQKEIKQRGEYCK